jgi:hypothetical protein
MTRSVFTKYRMISDSRRCSSTHLAALLLDWEWKLVALSKSVLMTHFSVPSVPQNTNKVSEIVRVQSEEGYFQN